MSAERTQFFYQELTLTASYDDNSFELKFTSRHVKMKLSNTASDNVEFSLIGADENKIDGKLLQGESENFEGLETSKLSFKGQGTLRVWAWK